MNSWRVALAMGVFACAPAAHAQPDTTPCDNNGAYDTGTGTGTCGGFDVDVKSLVCGDGFSEDRCVAKWVNGGGENEWYYFMGAGVGMDAGKLPAACGALPAGLAMVQYRPDGTPECYPAADLAGTSLAYTTGTNSTPASVTLNFAEHDDGSDTRNGYIKVTCAAAQGPYTTLGDAVESSFYEVEVSAPCAGAAPPSPPSPGPPVAPGHFRCVQDRCMDAGPGGGVSNATCHAICGPKPVKFACVNNRCVRSDHGLPSEAKCVEFCNPPGGQLLHAIGSVAGPKGTPNATPRELI